MNNPDQRRGVPSASGMERLVNCPASFDMERHAPDTESADAASGTRIHAVLALEASADTLTADEAETCEMCAAQATQVIEAWNESTGMVTPDQTLREQRLGMTALSRVLDVTPESKADFVFTGQADLILVKYDRALVIDYKTGRGDTATALDNAQLAGLAVLVAGRYNVQSVRVAIVQPWAGKPTVADYDANALALAKSWLLSAIHESAHSTPEDARAGDHCKWCKAKHVCEAYKQAALQVVEVIDPMTIAGMDNETQRKAMFARAMEMPAERLAATMRGLGMVKRFIAAIEGAARMRAAEDQAFQQFYTLKEKNGRRSISNVQLVAGRAFKHGVSVEDFTSFCSISLSATKDLLKKASGAKGKALDAIFDEVIDGATESGKPVMELMEVNA